MPPKVPKKPLQVEGGAHARGGTSSGGSRTQQSLSLPLGVELGPAQRRRRMSRGKESETANTNAESVADDDDDGKSLWMAGVRDIFNQRVITPGIGKQCAGCQQFQLDTYGNPKKTWACYKMPEIRNGQVLPPGTTGEADGDVCLDCELKCQAYPYQPHETTLKNANDIRMPGHRRKFDAMDVPKEEFSHEKWNRQNLIEVLGIFTNITTHRIWMSIPEFKNAYGLD